MSKKIFIISGPSGAGEDSVINGLKKIMPINVVVTTTTREIRSDESQGNPYYFISKDKFVKTRDSDGFFEWAKQYNSQLYGVTHKEINQVLENEKIGIWKIEYKGVITAKKKLPNVVAIMINAPENILIKRIKDRGDISEEILQERLEYNEKWLKNKDIYDYIVDNKEGELEKTIEKVANIIKKELK